jgi:ferredoxin-thioredoxin reductase catalytic chain
MNKEMEISDAAVDALLEKLRSEAEAGGYHLNPDREFARELVRSLLVNGERYGYWACPCRLAAGKKAADLDIICPCDYRDADLNEFGACFCALYVSREILEGKRRAASIPERRPPASERRAATVEASGPAPAGNLSQPVWRCKVCGYLCARGDPPETCPICKAKKDRFERFM